MPIFDVVGEKVFRVGDVGAGQIVKLGNNIMALANALVAMEAVRFVESFGVDRSLFFEVAQASSGASAAVRDWPNVDRYGIEHTLAGTPELPHRLAKDLRYAVSVAQERWISLPIVALCSQLLPGMVDERWKNAP
jgi:3-hydroxyisobutyrate dehydrogenase-like beta-hydroxyacid dehydrogenase